MLKNGGFDQDYEPQPPKFTCHVSDHWRSAPVTVQSSVAVGVFAPKLLVDAFFQAPGGQLGTGKGSLYGTHDMSYDLMIGRRWCLETRVNKFWMIKHILDFGPQQKHDSMKDKGLLDLRGSRSLEHEQNNQSELSSTNDFDKFSQLFSVKLSAVPPIPESSRDVGGNPFQSW